MFYMNILKVILSLNSLLIHPQRSVTTGTSLKGCSSQMRTLKVHLNATRRCIRMRQFVELIPRHAQRHITVWHSAEMILEMIYSCVFHTAMRRQHCKLFPRLGRVWEIFVKWMCWRSFIPFSCFWSASHVDSWAMTQVFVSLRGCCSSGSISMTDLIYPSRMQRGPRCRERELQ